MLMCIFSSAVNAITSFLISCELNTYYRGMKFVVISSLQVFLGRWFDKEKRFLQINSLCENTILTEILKKNFKLNNA